jgi:hypothetical protein
MVFSSSAQGSSGKGAKMSRRDFILVAGTATISSLLTYLVCATVPAPPDAPRYEAGATSGKHVAPPNYSVDQPEHVEAVTKKTVATVVVQPASSAPGDADHSGNTTPQDPALAFQAQQDLGKVFSSLVGDGGNSKPGSLNANIENRFYAEDWNQEWAGSKEKNIRTLFEASGNLSGMAPLQVTCRSKNCQVVLSASNQDQVRSLSERFMQAATKSDVGMRNKVVSFFPDSSTGRVVFYLSEDGNTDLFR